MRITYQKRDGCVMERFRSTIPPYKIGDSTSMGWKVLNIEYEYNGNYYSEYDYNKLIQKAKETSIKRKHLREKIVKELKTLLYYFIVIIIYNLIKILI